MRTTMHRRILTSEIKIAGVQLEEEGVHTEPLDSLFVVGKINEKKAQRLADEKYQRQYTKILVIDIETTEKLYQMEITDFVAHATEISK